MNIKSVCRAAINIHGGELYDNDKRYVAKLSISDVCGLRYTSEYFAEVVKTPDTNVPRFDIFIVKFENCQQIIQHFFWYAKLSTSICLLGGLV